MARPLCDNCGRPNFMGQQLLKVGTGVMACIDCFQFLTGSDPRDPSIELTARSGGGLYLTADEWRAAGEPRVPVPDPGPPAPPLPPRDRWEPRPPWWARALRWMALRLASER